MNQKTPETLQNSDKPDTPMPEPTEYTLIAPRTAIRQRVQRLLQDDLPAWDARITSGRVHASRVTPISPKRLPAVLIYTRDETLDKEQLDPGLRRHTLQLAVEVVAGGDDPAPDIRVDLLSTAVEAILDHNETLGLLVEGSRLVRVEHEADGDGDAVFVAARMLFEIVYLTRVLWLDASGLPEHLDEVAGTVPLNPLIPGITERLGDEPDVPRPETVLTSFTPHIGIPHEPDYQPLGVLLERPTPPCQGHDGR